MAEETMTEPMTDWDREKAFWDDPGRAPTYDLEHQGGYDSYNAMVRQKPGHMTAGEWVRAEDYRAEVEALHRRIAELTK
jgi:hypothetical protein